MSYMKTLALALATEDSNTLLSLGATGALCEGATCTSNGDESWHLDGVCLTCMHYNG